MKPFLRRLALTSAVLAALGCSSLVLAQSGKNTDIQQRFFAIVKGENPAYQQWLTYVD